MTASNPVESVLSLAAGVFNANSVVLFDTDENGSCRIFSAWSRGGDIDLAVTIRPGRGLVGWILRNDSPIAVSAIDENQTNLGYYKEDSDPGVRSFLGCPVPGGGILCVDSFEKAFAPAQQGLIGYFAETVSLLRSCAGRSESPSDAWLDALAKIARAPARSTGWRNYLGQVLATVQQASGFSYAAFAARPEGSETYFVESEYPPVRTGLQLESSLPVSDGIIGWVFRNEEPFRNDGSGAHMPLFGREEKGMNFPASICVPVRLDKSVRGVLCLASSEKTGISTDLAKFMDLAASEVGGQLDRLSLRYALKHASDKSK